MEKSNVERDKKIELIQEEMGKMKENLKNDIKGEIEKEMKVKNEAAHNEFLAKEIEKCSSNVIIHEMRSLDPDKDIREIFIFHKILNDFFFSFFFLVVIFYVIIIMGWVRLG